MRLYEIFEDRKDKKKIVIPSATPRNFVAKNQKTSGAGPHTDKKFTRKEKHKTTDIAE